jgi:hypothetical protein
MRGKSWCSRTTILNLREVLRIATRLSRLWCDRGGRVFEALDKPRCATRLRAQLGHAFEIEKPAPFGHFKELLP